MIYRPWRDDSNWEEKDPKLKQLEESSIRLPHADPVVKALSPQEGIFSILGPRQVGKSTLLRLIAKKCLKKCPADQVILVEGDEYESWRDLRATLAGFLQALPSRALKACFLIDEITGIPEWHRAIKTLADQGLLAHIFVVLTGSSSASLKEGGEFFPGRRGRHRQVDFELLPATYRHLKDHLSLEEYFVVGGFPWAVNEYLRLKVLPDYVGEIYWSWLKGEFLKRGKSDSLLRHLVKALVLRQSTGFSNNTMAREIGISSHDTAREYLQLLHDCFAVCEVLWMDPSEKTIAPRKNRKYYPLDPLLFHLFRQGGTLSGLKPGGTLEQNLVGPIAEAVVCQELRHRTKELYYWLGKREIDFLPFFIEVKYQEHVSSREFNWFEKMAPQKKKLLVLTKQDSFDAGRVHAMPLREWLIRLE